MAQQAPSYISSKPSATSGTGLGRKQEPSLWARASSAHSSEPELGAHRRRGVAGRETQESCLCQGPACHTSCVSFLRCCESNLHPACCRLGCPSRPTSSLTTCLLLLSANTSLLQDFRCQPASQLSRDRLSALIRRMASQQVLLKAWQVRSPGWHEWTGVSRARTGSQEKGPGDG